MDIEFDRIKQCSNCHHRHITTVAVIWCPNCDEGFCSDCEKFHSASKFAKFHTTITVNNYNKLPPFIADCKSHCEEHDGIYELFCKKHGQCCCLHCLKENHFACNDFDLLNEVVKNVKSAPALEDIEISLKYLGEIFQKLKENRFENKVRLEEQRSKFLEEVQCIRTTVNNHLDKIENIVKLKISSEVEIAQSKIDDVLQELEERSNKAVKLREEVDLMKHTATDLQIFLLLESLQKRIDEESSYLEGLENKLDEIDLELNVSACLSSISDELQSFAEIKCSHKPNTVSLSIGNKDQAQILLPHDISIYLKISDIHVVKKLKISYPSTVANITGCTILPDGKLLFVDFSKLSMSNTNGDFRDVICFGVDAWDVAYLGDNKAAITLTRQKKIVIVDLLLGVQGKTIDTVGECWGIDYVNGKLVVKISGKFLIMDDDGNILSNIPVECVTHVSASEDKIFGSNSKDSVLCYDKNGSAIWKFSDLILQGPRDITTDDKGFVYVACETSNNVVVISPDGKSCKEILNKFDGLEKPKAIHYEKILNKLLVCNESNGACLCDVCG